MEKIKLAICMKDLEYQNRFVNCFMNHYKHQYEIHIFTNLDQLKKSMPLEYAVIITGEYSTEEMASFVERGEILLALTEDDSGDNPNCTEKYREVYKIEEQIRRLAVSNEKRNSLYKGIVKYQTTGIYSLTREQYQTPFAVLVAKLYSEEKKVLILDLQGYSGLRECDEEVRPMGLEDLLSIAITGKYSKGRILESIHHEAEFDYVSPVHNNLCLLEGTKELFTIIMDTLAKEFGYERFIINFGTLFSGQIEMMQQCEAFYFLSGNETETNWREETFYRELQNLEKEDLLRTLKKISIPDATKQENSWRSLVERWSWGQLGENVRHGMQKEYIDGTNV